MNPPEHRPPRRPTPLLALGLAAGLLAMPTLDAIAASPATRDRGPIPRRGVSGVQVPSSLPRGVERPDIVVVIIDDVAQMDDRLWERLPTIKRLFLDSGARFTDYVGNDPLCCPGRVNLLTGQWTLHHGVIRNDARLFDSTTTVATELRGAGYWTGIFGKYLNQTMQLEDKWPPGWDQAFIFGGNYWNFTAWANGTPVHLGDDDEDYSTTVLQQRAVAALQKAPADRPRLVWLTPFGIHGGYDQQGKHRTLQPQPAPQDRGARVCADVLPWTTPANFEFDISDKPRYLQRFPIYPGRALVRSCETLLSIDRMLAAVLAELAAQGRPEPMVVLTADNGMAWGAHHWLLKHVPYATPMPLFIHWSALLGDAPVSVPTTVTNVDIAPTLCAIAGCIMGPYRNGFRADGISLMPLLRDVGRANRGATPGTFRVLRSGVTRTFSGVIKDLRVGREVVFSEQRTGEGARGMPPWRNVRTTDAARIGRWSWTRYATGETELYNIAGGPCWRWHAGMPGDPCMLTNLTGDPAYAHIRAILMATLDARERRSMRLTYPPRRVWLRTQPSGGRLGR